MEQESAKISGDHIFNTGAGFDNPLNDEMRELNVAWIRGDQHFPSEEESTFQRNIKRMLVGRRKKESEYIKQRQN